MQKKIACIQMDISFGQPQENYEKAKKWIEKAAKENCDIAVLPELWTTGYDLTRLDDIADRQAEKTIAFLSDLAKEHHIDLVAGSVANQQNDGVENTLLIINRSGELVKQYSKLHLFRLMDEHKHLQAGKQDGLFELHGEKMGGVICYDIRFPEWIRKHVLSGAKAMFVVAEWPLARVDHWKTLLTARAIENQCYVIACNRSGSDPNNEFAGHSMMIGPWGEIIAEASKEEQLLIGEIDLSQVEEVRKRIPVFEDRLSDFY
ncbi:MAG TPA: carbon-nitrogen family hydrolase [Chondromyces sp.]|nr:carbon-nitrogen family hydrolase [Chondromyces sp.]